MIEYEVVRKVPTGIRVVIYSDGQELIALNVPATQCQTVAKLEGFLRQIAAREKNNETVPAEVLSLRGKRPL